MLEDTLPFPCAHRQMQLNTHRQTHTLKHTNSNTHNLLPTSLRPHTSAFKLQQRAACHCHIFFPKSQLKTADVCMRECVQSCVCVYVSVCVCVRGLGGCFGKKILIGKLYLWAPRDCAATVNDLSEKCIPECTWGALAPGRLLNDL